MGYWKSLARSLLLNKAKVWSLAFYGSIFSFREYFSLYVDSLWWSLLGFSDWEGLKQALRSQFFDDLFLAFPRPEKTRSPFYMMKESKLSCFKEEGNKKKIKKRKKRGKEKFVFSSLILFCFWATNFLGEKIKGMQGKTQKDNFFSSLTFVWTDE